MNDPVPGDNRPIGVFDSGLGGLTVMAAMMRQLPAESILYLGDTARLPYGSKSPQTVRRYTHRNVDFLRQRGVKAVVVACNTASALALPDFDAPLPVWGVVEPGAETAVAVTRGRVGVIGTESTVRSNAYAEALHRLRPDLEVLSQACPLLVPLVEEGWSDDPIAEQILARYLAPLLAAEIDTLVLGCTHYPLLAPMLHRLLGTQVTLVDSAEAMARKVATELERLGLAAAPSGTVPQHPPQHHLCVTDAGDRFERLAVDFLRHPVSLEWVEV